MKTIVQFNLIWLGENDYCTDPNTLYVFGFIIIFVILMAISYISLNFFMNRKRRKVLSQWEVGDTLRLFKTSGEYQTDTTPDDIFAIICMNAKPEQRWIDVNLLRWYEREAIIEVTCYDGRKVEKKVKIRQEWYQNISNESFNKRKEKEKFDKNEEKMKNFINKK